MRLSRGSQVFLVVLVLLLGAGFLGIQRFNAGAPAGEDGPDVPPGQPITVEVPSGSSATAIAELMEAQGVIESERSLRLLLSSDERSRSIQAGTYQLQTGMDEAVVFDRLLAGPERPDVFTVTIPEGLTVEQTLQRIADAEGSPFTPEELVEALPSVALPDWVPAADDLPEGANRYEGMLFPLTYEFRADAAPEDVLARLVAQTDEIVGGLQTPVGGGPYEVLTVASLVEREARVSEERDDIAAVIYNRLEEPMRLQIDATVLYALGETSADAVTFEDLEIDSPWNTYENDGLPPTPIAGVGRAAVEAAVQPADTDDRFYVVCNIEEGRHVFTDSNDEHNQNVARFRELREGDGEPFCPEAASDGASE